MTYSNLWPNNEWSRQHLNWALVVYGWLTGIPAYFVLEVLEESKNGVLQVFSIIFIAMVALWNLYLAIWNLKHKGRSLWNLTYFLIPWIGGIIFLCIGNRDQLAREKTEREERERYQEEYWKRVEVESQDKKSQ